MQETNDFGTLEKFAEIYVAHFDPSTAYDVIKRSYERWVSYQNMYNAATPEERNRPYVIWENFPTAESWVKREKEQEEHRIKMSKATQEWFAKPWYERETEGSPIQKEIIKAFIDDPKGKEIRSSLLLWNIEPEQLAPALKHFCSFIAIPDSDKNDLDSYISNFIQEKRGYLGGWGIGVCGDGGRVFRTIFIACSLLTGTAKDILL